MMANDEEILREAQHLVGIHNDRRELLKEYAEEFAELGVDRKFAPLFKQVMDVLTDDGLDVDRVGKRLENAIQRKRQAIQPGKVA